MRERESGRRVRERERERKREREKERKMGEREREREREKEIMDVPVIMQRQVPQLQTIAKTVEAQEMQFHRQILWTSL